jgi:hypothetical protein
VALVSNLIDVTGANALLTLDEALAGGMRLSEDVRYERVHPPRS